jgi:hypothetical protein
MGSLGVCVRLQNLQTDFHSVKGLKRTSSHAQYVIRRNFQPSHTLVMEVLRQPNCNGSLTQ